MLFMRCLWASPSAAFSSSSSLWTSSSYPLSRLRPRDWGPQDERNLNKTLITRRLITRHKGKNTARRRNRLMARETETGRAWIHVLYVGWRWNNVRGNSDVGWRGEQDGARGFSLSAVFFSWIVIIRRRNNIMTLNNHRVAIISILLYSRILTLHLNYCIIVVERPLNGR